MYLHKAQQASAWKLVRAPSAPHLVLRLLKPSKFTADAPLHDGTSVAQWVALSQQVWY